MMTEDELRREVYAILLSVRMPKFGDGGRSR